MTPQAQEVVDRFKPFAIPSYGDKAKPYCAIQCAILAVEMQLEFPVYEHWRVEELKHILTELKNEL